MEYLLQQIKLRKLPCYFISPHLDDALFSAGDVAADLAQHTDVTVVTVFTEVSTGPTTLSARQYLKQCGFADAPTLFTARRAEDIAVCERFNIRPVHLGYTDALWRVLPKPSWWRRVFGSLVPELLHRYPTYRYHAETGVVTASDTELMDALTVRLHELIPSDAVVFVPFGLGHHVDHAIVNKVCLSQFATCIRWADFPYNIRSEQEAAGVTWQQHQPDPQRKRVMMLAYDTQRVAMNLETLPIVPESFVTSEVA